MKTHGNLYKDWESLNEKFKLTFFNHTQRGGHSRKESTENETSYIKPIFMFFQWEVLWISGVAEEHFLENIEIKPKKLIINFSASY
jgi:hypothetical protein